MNPSTLREVYETRWRHILLALMVYEAAYLLGAFLGTALPNILGVGFLFVSLFFFAPASFIRPKRQVFRLALWPMAAMAVATLLNLSHTDFYSLVKFSSFFVLFVILGSGLPYPIAESRNLRLFALLVLFPILLSFVWGRKTTFAEEVRMAGVFANANNLALMAFLIPWIFPKGMKGITRNAVHGLVLAIILISSTLGALVAYVAALVLDRQSKQSLLVLAGLGGFAVLIAVVFQNSLFQFLEQFSVMQKLLTQYQVLAENFHSLTGEVDFGILKEKYGEQALSGIWRLSHWLNILALIARDGPWRLFFGHGVGASYSLLPLLPHNDYLRILFEQGLFGLGTFIGFFCYGVLRRVAPEHRYLVLAFLLYCFTENNIDNFLFMTLFAVVISVRPRPEPVPTTGKRHSAAPGPAAEGDLKRAKPA